MRTRTVTVIAALVLSAAAGVEAGTLTSGSIQGETFICRAVNVGSKDINSVTVDIVNSGTGLVAATQTCPDVAANRECFRIFPTSTIVAFCRITSSGGARNIRATFLGASGTTSHIIEPR